MVQKQALSAVRQLKQALTRSVTEEALAALKGPRSRWPVKSSRSKNSFYSDGNTIRTIAPYAKYIEAKSRRPPKPARSTIEAQRGEIVIKARQRALREVR